MSQSWRRAALVYSTYLGGTTSYSGDGIAVDNSGNAYVTGSTTSTDFPTANALHGTNAGGYDAFVTKLATPASLQLAATVAPATAPATSIVTATVRITNTGLQATSAVTLTLTEGEGMLHAPADDDSFGRAETVNGRNNVVHFDSGSFASGEQKTFQIPIMLTPSLSTEPVVVRASVGAVNAAGERASTEISATATPLIEAPANAPALERLLTLPVADVGETPDAIFAAGGPTASSAATAQVTTALFPSDYGDLWSLYLADSLNKWSPSDRASCTTRSSAPA